MIDLYSTVMAVIGEPNSMVDVTLDHDRISKLTPIEFAVLSARLFDSNSYSTDELICLATERVLKSKRGIETFVPIFISNYCDAECKMCGMRSANTELERKYASKQKILDQLEIIYQGEGVKAVGFLTGEYEDSYFRHLNVFKTGWAIAEALCMGFERIYFNIGSMNNEEIQTLSEWIPRKARNHVTMCVFQETYNPARYAKVIGTTNNNPKSDYSRRISSFDRWLDAGFKQVNPGILIGLADTRSELACLTFHAAKLAERGADVLASMPRVRPALGVSHKPKVKDDEYLRAIAIFTILLPKMGIVITTREDSEFQKKVLPFIRCLSPGSPDVTPYGKKVLSNDEISSQFSIPDKRSPSEVLSPLQKCGINFTYFNQSKKN